MIVVGLVLIFVMLHEARANTCDPTYPDIRYGVVMTGESPGGWAYWWCVKNGVVSFDWRMITADEVTPDLITALKDYSQGRNPDFIHTAPGSPDDPKYNALKRAMNAVMLADAGKPVVASWAVSKNGTSPTRPAFPIVNGKRSFSSDGTVAVGSPCSDAVKFVEGSLTFLQVSPGHVAVCSTTP